MNFSNAAYDLADRRAEQERAAGIRRISAAVAPAAMPSGPVACCDCGGIIPPARRAAYPNALRCIDCATFLERSPRRT